MPLTELPLGLAGRIFRSPMPFGTYDPQGEVLTAYMQKEVSVSVLLAEDEECLRKAGRNLRCLYEEIGFKVIHLPIPDFGVPPNGDLVRAVNAVIEYAQTGRNIAIHCSAGIGRTGLFVALLAKQVLGFSGEEAIAWARKYIPGAVETVEQRQLVVGDSGYKYVEVDAQFINKRKSEISKEMEKLGKIKPKIAKATRVVEDIALEFGYLIRELEDLGVEQERRSLRWKFNEIQMTVRDAPPRQFEEIVHEAEHYLELDMQGLKEIEEKLRDHEKVRIECPSPSEEDTVELVLGRNATFELRKERTGFNSQCVCLDCLHQFEADLRDEVANPWRSDYDAPDVDTFLIGLSRLLAVNKVTF